MLMMKIEQFNRTAGGDVVAGYEPEGDMVEAKYERGASDYGKMSIRNKRAVGTMVVMPLTQKRLQKLHAERMKKHKGVTEATRYAKETGKSFKSGKPCVKVEQQRMIRHFKQLQKYMLVR